MFILKELWCKNFRSYKEFHLKDISNFGLTLINGDNGAGKSTIRLALEYLLTDSMSDSISVDEFTFNKKGNCELGCIIQKDDDLIKIVKYREHKKNKNSTVLEINGESKGFTESDRRATQKNIEQLLGVTKESLSISSIFSQNSMSFPECKESERKAILYDAMNLHKYQNKHIKAKEKESLVLKNIDEVESLYLNARNSIDESINRLASLAEKIEEWEEKRDKDIENYNSKIETIVNEKGNSLDNIKLEKNKLLKEIEKLKEEIKSIEKLITEGDLEIKKEFDEEFSKLKKSRMQTEFEIRSLNKEYSKLGDGQCPILNILCKDLLKNEDKIRTELESKQMGAKKALEEILITIEKMECTEEEYKEIEKLNNNFKEKINNLNYRIDMYKREVQHKDELISNALKEEQSFKKRIKELKELIKEKEAEENPYIMLAETERNYLNDRKRELKDLDNQKKELEEELKYWGFIKIMYSKTGIPNMKIEGFLESLELETNKILGVISDKMYVTIDSQGLTKSGEVREKIGYSVYHPDKQIQDYHSYSGGERQRVRIADMIAFQELLGKFDFMMMDEVLELSLDSSGKTNIIQLLKSVDLNSLFVVSHDQEVKDSFNKVLNIKKEDGVSYIR